VQFSATDRREEEEEEDVPMLKTMLGLAAAAAIVMLAASNGNVSAETAKAPPKPPACNTLKEEFACKGRDDCTWVAAVVDAKTNKEKRKAYCRRAPAAAKKPAK
jgi:hypothetical protein